MSGLVGWWPLHENSGRANDLSGQGNHGDVIGPVQGVGGRGGLTSYSFDGTDDGIDLGRVEDGPVDQITVTAWVNARSIRPSAADRIVTKFDGAGSDPGLIILDIYPETTRFVINDSGGTQDANGSSAFNTDQWYFLCGVYDEGSVRLYEDGSLVDQITATDTSIPSYATRWGIGEDVASAGSIDTGETFDGQIFDVRVYNRALTVDEIQFLHELGSADLAQPPDNNDGGVSYWNFNSANANDQWGSNDGTVTGATHVADGGPRGDGAYSFDGTDDHIDLGFTGPFADGTFTAMGWMKMDDTTTQTLLDTYDGSFPQVSIQYNESVDDLHFRLNDGTNTMTPSAGVQPTDVWMHVVGIRDGDNASLYLNGVHEETQTNTSLATDLTGANIRLGRRPDGNSVLAGDLDDIRIYSRALEPWEISELYRYGTLGRDMRAMTVRV